MELFYFDINDGHTRAIDDIGHEYPDIESARRAAVRELALIFRDEVPDGERRQLVVTLRNADGVPIYVATATLLCETLEHR